MKVATTKKTTLGAIAKAHGITRNTLTAWQEEGVDIYNDQAMSDRVVVKRLGGGKVEGGTEMQKERLRKLRAEARTAEMRADQQEGKLISLDEICNMMTSLGATLKAQMNKFRADLPPMLYGRNHAEMTTVIAAAVDRTLQGICDELEAIKTDPPRPE
jgi:hypothetical protein